ncbi:hypothetical protein TNCV_442631 [Trichonephila clavipes]|nr:hypothetical protein TNCV_442631 [Trichonephila clavipes]
MKIMIEYGAANIQTLKSTELEEGYSKYGTKCLKTSYRTCMPQCPIVSHRAFALEGVQQAMWAVNDLNEEEFWPVVIQTYPQCQYDLAVYSPPDVELDMVSEFG